MFLKPKTIFKVRWITLVVLAAAVLFFLVWFFSPGKVFEVPYSMVLTDRSGALLSATIAADEQWRFPPMAKIPQKYRQSVVCFEDKRFYYHPGVDPLALGRAMWQNISRRHIVSGASTLTMQVIRLSRMGRERTPGEKLIEMFLALRLEMCKSKEEVLRLYASHAPFGGNVVGLEAAAWRYFGRQPQQLSWAESAALAVLPNSPALIFPGRNQDRYLRKRNHLLERLHEKGHIDSLTCRLAKAERLPAAPFDLPAMAPHLLQRLNAAKTGRIGKKVSLHQTTIDVELQKKAIAVLNHHHQRLAANGINNGAALLADVQTGEVLAYVGNIMPAGRAHGCYVDVITAPRSTGSILKPFLYAAMLQNGELLPSQLVSDIPTRISGYAPENYDRTFRGAVPADMALARSLNVPAVRLLYRYNVDRFYTLLRDLGMSTLFRRADDYGLSLILGGAEATLWDMCQMYANMAQAVNHFHHRRLPQTSCLTVIRDESQKEPLAMNLFAPGASWLTLRAMLEVTRPGIESGWRQFTSSRRVAWKTGTSFGFRDAWAIGVTPEYVVGVWIGNADGEGRPGLVGLYTAAPVLFALFDMLPPTSWFARPEADLMQAKICDQSGYRAGMHCRSAKSEWVPRSALKTPACPYCRIVHLDSSACFQVNTDCASVADMISQNRFVLPPAMEWFYKQYHSDYEPLPPYHPDCIHNMSTDHVAFMSILYPDRKGKIFVPREMDGRLGRVVFEAAHRKASTTVHWHLDKAYMGTTTDIHQMAFAPDAGSHLLTLVDEYGNRAEREFMVLARD
ncbi:penicillin-binding protein 1C [candidate division KSB1 bacterium]|nr:penicillin-binding protein 1C [candidate division KSB1 bacterium]